MKMAIRLEFLGWQQPALVSASDYLFGRYEQAGQSLVDLSDVLLVLPSSRAGRRLREILLVEAEQRQQAFFPPQITTVGALPEFLYERKRPFASPLLQQLVWAEALRGADAKTLTRVLKGRPQSSDDPQWLELAAMLQQQHQELAGDRLNFTDVAAQCQRIEAFAEYHRWQALAMIQHDYLSRLDRLHQWDRQTARLFALRHAACATSREILLVGTVDMNQTLRGMLDQVAQRVTSLIFAPPSQAHRFDQHGCVVPAEWEGFRLSLACDQLVLANDPANQADAVAQSLAALGSRYHPDEIVIGVPHAELVPTLENKLSQLGLSGRWGAGQTLATSRPLQLLRSVADCVGDWRMSRFVELLRHPDIEAWLHRRRARPDEGASSALVKLDDYLARHFVFDLTAAKEVGEKLPEEVTSLVELLEPLRGDARRPAAWADLILELLAEVYGEVAVSLQESPERAVVLACEQLRQALDELHDLPLELAMRVPAASALLMAVNAVQQTHVAPPADPEAIEMVGWLDLPWDDAPAMVVTCFNEGIVPQASAADMFLPNRLRSELGIDDNRRRYARDAYGLQLLVSSRPWLRVVLGRRSGLGDPLKPSRLLFACEDEIIAARCQRFFDPAVLTEVVPCELSASRAESALVVPRPLPLSTPLGALAVTGFRTYLNCPYQFYLEHVLRLRKAKDDLPELDAGAFGDLAHEVLAAFGTEAEPREAVEAEPIAEFLVDTLRRLAARRFGRRPRVAIQVQLRQLETRLRAFARHQAAWRDAGWQILHVEQEHEGVPLVVDGEPFYLKGKIDRIDYNNRDAQPRYAILDYKTSAVAKTPEKAHRKKIGGRWKWVELQLPLYELIAQAFQLPGPFCFGYVCLPDDPQATAIELADWTATDLQEARGVATEVIRRIRRQEFWPPSSEKSSFGGFPRDVAPICQDGVFLRRLAAPPREVSV